MEVIDGEDVPLEAVVDLLLHPKNLARLVDHYGAACFVLARAAQMPDFFERLISSSATIDSTTSNNIAFIVFHGKESSIIEERGNRRYRHHILGMSSSSRQEVDLQYLFKDDHHRTRGWEPQFSRSIMDGVRTQRFGRSQHQSLISTTERAVSYLANAFGVKERDMPCLLFVDDRLEPVVVPFDDYGSVGTLYSQILAPLSDALADAEAYRAALHQLRSHEQRVLRARRDLNDHPEKIEETRKKIKALEEKQNELARRLGEESNGRELSKLENEQDELRELCDRYRIAKSPEDRENLLPEGSAIRREAEALRIRQKAVEAEKKEAFKNGMLETDPERMALLGKCVHQLQREHAACVAQPFTQARARLEAVYIELKNHRPSAEEDEVSRGLKAAQSQLGSLNRRISEVNNILENASETEFDLREKLDRLSRSIRMEPYGKVVVETDGGRTLDIVREMRSGGHIGSSERKIASSRLKILMLAANPAATSRLDLEEEIRGLDLELESVKFRDKIDFVAKHAVRAGDLVRLLRREAPDVVHFSGHGSPDGIILRDEEHGYSVAGGDALAKLFLDRGVRLVVLNSCYSTKQAEPISRSVGAVVGTTDAVQDSAAIEFTKAFYRTVGDGFTVADAFRDGGDAVSLQNLGDVFAAIGDHSIRLVF